MAQPRNGPSTGSGVLRGGRRNDKSLFDLRALQLPLLTFARYVWEMLARWPHRSKETTMRAYG
jgi:hypothetical protein